MKNRTPLWRELIFKSKCPKHIRLGPLFEMQMSKNGTPLRREAHFQVRM